MAESAAAMLQSLLTMAKSEAAMLKSSLARMEVRQLD